MGRRESTTTTGGGGPEISKCSDSRSGNKSRSPRRPAPSSSSSSAAAPPPPRGGRRQRSPRRHPAPPRAGGGGGSSMISSSSATTTSSSSVPPPPPPQSELRRAGYLRAEPGAQRCPGTRAAPNDDDGTIIIGDGPAAGQQQGRPPPPPHPMVSEQLVSARLVQSSRSVERPITATVQSIPEGTSEARASNKGGRKVAAATAEPMEEGDDKPEPFWKDGKVVCCILVLLVLAVGLGAGLAIGLRNNDDDDDGGGASQASRVGATAAPTAAAPTSPAPTSAPTEFLLYDPPDAATCRAIADGDVVTGQEENMTIQEFYLQFDATMLPGVPEIWPHLDRINRFLQRDVAPEIAQCAHRNTRALRKNRGLLTKYIIGNAIFDYVVEDESGCSSGEDQQNCFRVLAVLLIYVKGEVQSFDLLGHIMDSFSEGLELGIPFESFEFVGNSASGPDEDLAGDGGDGGTIIIFDDGDDGTIIFDDGDDGTIIFDDDS